jgi:4'-phosphopantetheinyl transferase
MIYKLIVEELPERASAHEYHFWGEKLLTFSLLREKGIRYREEPITKNPWGKPSMKNHPDIQYSISYSGNCIVCVIGDIYPVGIDVEKIRSFNPYAAQRVCTSTELEAIYSSSCPDREFFRYWTLKESYIKAIGRGLSYPMKNVGFTVGPAGEVASGIPNCSFWLIEDPEGFITAVCYTNISERQWMNEGFYTVQECQEDL